MERNLIRESVQGAAVEAVHDTVEAGIGDGRLESGPAKDLTSESQGLGRNKDSINDMNDSICGLVRSNDNCITTETTFDDNWLSGIFGCNDYGGETDGGVENLKTNSNFMVRL